MIRVQEVEMFRAWEVRDGRNLGDGGDQSREVEIDHGLRSVGVCRGLISVMVGSCQDGGYWTVGTDGVGVYPPR